MFNEHNKMLLNKLIPEKNLPIYGKSVIDVNDPVFNEPLSKKIVYAKRNSCNIED